MERNYFIYKYTFTNGKVYIGQTFEGSGRFGCVSKYSNQLVYKAMKKYPDFKKEILKADLTKDDVDYFEQYYINHYQSMKLEYGYNLTSGGNKNKTYSDEVKKKISIANKGKTKGIHKSLETEFKKGKDHPKSKKVYQYDKDLNLIKIWDSVRDVERELGFNHGSISSCCLGKMKMAYNHIWSYSEII